MPKKILVVDDEPGILEICQAYLKAAGFDVIPVADGSKALFIANFEKPDLVVLDVMLPGMSGLDVCRELRRTSDVPIIMLSARVEEVDRLIGLEIGADDYMTKPFSPHELVARVRTILRRARTDSGNPIVRVGEVILDRKCYRADFPGRSVRLTPSEFEILATLMSQPGRVFSRSQLLNAVHGNDFDCCGRAVDSHVRNLRRKVELDNGNRYIVTVPCVGYKFEA